MAESVILKKIIILLHLIGFGTIVSLLLSGPILERKFLRTETLEGKLAILRSLKSIGLLSPFAVVLMLATGIGNMYYEDLGPFKAGWLTAKIIFFAIVVINGVMATTRATARRKLLERLGQGETAPNALTNMQRYNKQQSVFYLTQTILVLIILVLSVFKPE